MPPDDVSGIFYNVGATIVLSIITCGVWGLVWTFKSGEDLKTYNRDGLGGIVMLIIGILLFPIVMFLIPAEIEKMYVRDGRTSPVSALWGLWFLLPLIGNIIWYVKMQGALNDFWRSKGSRG